MEVCQAIYKKLDTKYVEKDLDIIIEAAQNHGVYEHENAKVLETHVREISNLLHQKTTRRNAIKFLVPLIQQCPKDILTAQGQTWLQFCTMIITAPSGTKAKRTACYAILLLLERIPKLPELQRTLLAQSAAPLVTSLAGAYSYWSPAALKCLQEYMKLFPQQCLPHKVAIEELLLKKLDSPLTCAGQVSEVTYAGQAYATLPLAGIGGKGTSSRSEARGRQLTQLICLSHHLMDYLFDGLVEKESYKHPREYTFKLNPLQPAGYYNKDPLYTHTLAITRLMNALKFISEMVTCKNNDAVSMKFSDLLGPVFRLLQMETSVLKSYQSYEHKLLAFFMPALHQQCLLMLRDFLISLRDSVDLYFGLIAELLAATIKSYYNSNAKAWATNGQQTRIIAYSVMTTLVEVSQGRHPVSPKLIEVIVEDLMPKNQEFTIKSYGSKGLTNLTLQKKKSKKKGYSVSTKDSEPTNTPLPEYENFGRVVTAALGLAEGLFRYATHSMSLMSRQLLQKRVIAVTDRVMNGSQMPVIYSEETARAQLFKTLTCMATHPDSRCPIPYTMILHLFQMGLHDHHMSVVAACQTGLSCVSYITANPQISMLTQVFEQLQSKADSYGTEDKEENLENDVNGMDNEEEEANPDSGNEKVEEEQEGEEEEQEDEVEEVEEEENKDEPETAEKSENMDDEQSEQGAVENTEESMEEVEEVIDEQEEEHEAEVEVEEEEEEEEDEEGDVKAEGQLENKQEKSPKKKGKQNKKKQQKLRKKKRAKQAKNQTPDSKDKSKATKRNASDSEGSTPKKSKKNEKKDDGLGPSVEEMLAAFVEADPDD
ncbi:uncharacterized protein LOC122255886 isoform X2 [Penaeus japonicus]|uniref:uncharacterized protein LOC122255886 isoform X2 n=1 Tax=Penaeus japonicus TaxID=27405 RepID=UPI001C712BBE|nr:uncharacterized protein LOC122255886 isoform X2 [Penaeus japonicus]